LLFAMENDIINDESIIKVCMLVLVLVLVLVTMPEDEWIKMEIIIHRVKKGDRF
jgi:hypothetical protein